MKKLLLLLLTCLAIASLLLLTVSCRNTEARDERDAPVAVGDSVLRVAYLPTLDALPFFVAFERGLFAREGLDVELVRFLSGMDVDTALVGGSVDLAFTDIIRAEHLRRQEGGGTGLTYVTSTEVAWSLISCRTARLNRLEQFGDKMIAMSRFSATDYLTDRTFGKVKTKAPVFKVQINDVDLRLRMLLTGEMDAGWLPEPQATEALLHNHKLVLRQDGDSLGVLVMRSSLPACQTLAGKMASVYSMACDTINKNGIEAYADEMMKYCDADTAVTRRIPKTRFAKASKPSGRQISIATDYLATGN